METILAIGENVELLRSRALVLEKTGASATYCTVVDFPAHWADRGIGLVVLCHTLEPEERRLILEKVGQRWPAARILQVSRDYGDDVKQAYVDDWVLAWEPEKLLRQAKELLDSSAKVRHRLA